MALLVLMLGIPASRAAAVTQASLPKDTRIYARLETEVSTADSHLHEAITARVVRDVQIAGGVGLPMNSVLNGTIERLIPSSTPTDRAVVLLHFKTVTLPGGSSLPLQVRLVEVENSRETVQADGSIQGVLQSEVPVGYIQKAVEKVEQSNPSMGGQMQKAQDKALGKLNTGIDFPKNTDLILALDQPLHLPEVYPPSIPEEVPASVAGPVERLFTGLPQRVSGKDGKPGDPVNLVFVGSLREIQQVFEASGWSVAQTKNSKSVLDTVRAMAGNVGYGQAPVSDLYLYGRKEDMAFEKMLDTFTKRHHLRIWKAPVGTADGREIWVGAATHDSGLDIRPGVVSHAIDSDLDAERAKVGGDLGSTGQVSAEQLFTRPHPLSAGLTATGAPWKTDGRLLVIVLKGAPGAM
jgi:LssY C-terminus